MPSIEELLMEYGYEGLKILQNYSYDTALIGVTTPDCRAVYDYNRMVDWLIEHEKFSTEDAMEWIDYNTIRALPYMEPGAPIVVMPIDTEGYITEEEEIP